MFNELKGWFVSHFLTPFNKQDDETRRQTYTYLQVFMATTAISALTLILYFSAATWIDPSSPAFLLVKLSQLFVFQVPVAAVGIVLGWYSFVLLYKAFLRSPVGKTHVVWKRRKDGEHPEPIEVRQSKLRNGGIIAAMLLFGCLLYWALMLRGASL